MTLAPAFSDFEQVYADGKAQVIIDRIVSDLETPVSAYLKLAARRRNAFLLESVEGGEHLARYSIIGVKPDAIWRAEGDTAWLNLEATSSQDAFAKQDASPLESLKQFVDQSRIELPTNAPPMAAGVFGYFGYDCVRQIEKLPGRPKDDLGVPDALFIRPTIVAVFGNVL